MYSPSYQSHRLCQLTHRGRRTHDSGSQLREAGFLTTHTCSCCDCNPHVLQQTRHNNSLTKVRNIYGAACLRNRKQKWKLHHCGMEDVAGSKGSLKPQATLTLNHKPTRHSLQLCIVLKTLPKIYIFGRLPAVKIFF